MRRVSIIIDILLYIIVAVVLVAAIASAIKDRPMLFSAVRSNSMYPMFQRGDMILITSVSETTPVNIEDIVIFRAETGSLSANGWIVHRIIEGDDVLGYITKGDANTYSDQASGGTGPIKREWIVSKVITLANYPIKIPLLGFLPLWMEEIKASPYAMPVITVILAAIIMISEITNNKKRNKKKKSNLDLPLVYLLGGLTITIIMVATMLACSQRIIVKYEVTDNGNGILSGSGIGVFKVGEKSKKPLSELNNKGFFPITSTITTKDTQITFSHSLFTLSPNETIETEMELNALTIGEYNTIIHVGLFYPFLPSSLIYYLSSINYWLALVTVSLVPGLPLMLYPLIELRMRKKIIKETRRFFQRLVRYVEFINF